MILAGTSIWVDHLRRADPVFDGLLRRANILMHPVVLGELALGMLPDRNTTMRILRSLPRAEVARDNEVLRLIEDWRLSGTGIGYSDAHLLASVLLTSGARLWTRDKRLRLVARQLSLDARLR
jgi:predicted nucleic acid-binding protein